MGTDNLYQRVIDSFRKTGSVKKTAETVSTTLVRAQRILITEGLWSSPTSEKIMDLYRKGKTVQEMSVNCLSQRRLCRHICRIHGRVKDTVEMIAQQMRLKVQDAGQEVLEW